MKKNQTQPKTIWFPVMFFLLLPLLSFENKIPGPCTVGIIHSNSATGRPASPDVKSWAFLRNIVGSRYSDIQAPLKEYGFRFEESKDFQQGISYYYSKPIADDYLKDLKDYYTIVTKNGKIRGVMIEFVKGGMKSDEALRKKWTPFEKGFLEDNYKKVNESEEEYSISRDYRNNAQRTKIRVNISKEKDVYDMVEVILCEEDLDIAGED